MNEQEYLKQFIHDDSPKVVSKTISQFICSHCGELVTFEYIKYDDGSGMSIMNGLKTVDWKPRRNLEIMPLEMTADDH